MANTTITTLGGMSPMITTSTSAGNSPSNNRFARMGTQMATLNNGSLTPIAQAQPQATNIIVPQQGRYLSDPAQIQSANLWQLPDSLSFTISNTSTADTQVYIWNRGTLNNITANVTYSYPSGSLGEPIINSLVTGARANLGAITYGFALMCNVTSSGAADSAGAGRINPAFLDYNCYGNPLFTNVTLDNISKSDFSDNIWTINCIKNISLATQMRLTIPALDTVTLITYFTPYFKR